LEQDRPGRQAEKRADHPSGETGSHTSVGKVHIQEEIISLPASLWIELISTKKSTLFSVKSVSQLSVDKFNDPEFRKYARKSIAQDIKKIDSVLNSLLNYIQINTCGGRYSMVPLPAQTHHPVFQTMKSCSLHPNASSP
jgi:hypothetical protein